MAGELPETLSIGTRKAFAKNYAYPYTKEQIASEIIYMCNKGSEWARPHEVLVLRRENGAWTAYDTYISSDKKKSSTAVRQFSVARVATLHNGVGTHGKSITMPILMAPALRSIGRGNFWLKPGCLDAMMHHA